jgi:2-dehydropantoate 2-reductase
MSEQSKRKKVAVVGAGAVGGYFGGMLARARVPVVLIGRPAFAEAVNENGLRIDSVQFQETVRAEAASEISAAAGADIVLFCVKTTDTVSVSRELKKHISAESVVVSLQNGVNNVEEIRNASGIEAIPSVVYVAAAMPVPGVIKHLGRGDLVVGPVNERTEQLASYLASGNVPCRVTDNIEGELWTKLVWNCALNAVSALGRSTYGEIHASANALRLVENLVHEVLNVARAKGVHPPGLEDPKAALAGAMKIAEQMSGTRSSTAQDMVRNKKTEIDSLNGYVAKLGEKLGVPAPVNQAMHALVKLVEATY